MDLQTVKKYVKPPKYKTVVLKKEGSTQDIINEIQKVFIEDKKQVSEVAKLFKRSTILETCRYVWDFLKQNIRYQADDFSEMLIKTPSRLVYDKFADCKGYSIFIKSVLDYLGIASSFRFVAYPSDKEPTHVYVVAYDEAGKEIIIDACLNNFNFELPYKFKIDMPGTKITKINGVSNAKGSYDQYHSYIMCPAPYANIGVGYVPEGRVNEFYTNFSEGEMLPNNMPISKKFNWDNLGNIIDKVGQGVQIVKGVVDVIKPKMPILPLVDPTLPTENPLIVKEEIKKPADNTLLYVFGLGALWLAFGQGGKKVKGKK